MLSLSALGALDYRVRLALSNPEPKILGRKGFCTKCHNADEDTHEQQTPDGRRGIPANELRRGGLRISGRRNCREEHGRTTAWRHSNYFGASASRIAPETRNSSSN